MKVKEVKNKIIIAELDPDKDYICLVNPEITRMDTIKFVEPIRKKAIPIVLVLDVNKAVRFVEVPKK